MSVLDIVLWVLTGIAGITVVGTILLCVVTQPVFTLWIQSFISGGSLSFLGLLAMARRRSDVRTIAYTHIRLVKAKIDIPVESLEVHSMAGGNLPNIASSLIFAANHGIPLDWSVATAIDLAGRDILELVQQASVTRVMTWPDRASGTDVIRAMPKDGTPVDVELRVHVRTDLDRVLGGATDETLRRHLEHCVTEIIEAQPTGTLAVTSPDRLATAILKRRPDRGAASRIQSIEARVKWA